MPAPAHYYASSSASSEGSARAEAGAIPARRLHARARRRQGHVHYGATRAGASGPPRWLWNPSRLNLAVAHIVKDAHDLAVGVTHEPLFDEEAACEECIKLARQKFDGCIPAPSFV
jgi:hypothetical protein